MDPNASLDLDDQVVAMMEEENGPVDPPPAPDPAPAPEAPAGETPAAPPPEPAPAEAPVAEGSETPPAAPAPEPQAPPVAAAPPELDLTTVSPEMTQAILDKYVFDQSKGAFKTATDLETAKGFEVLATVPSLTDTVNTLKENEIVLASPLMKSLNEYTAKGGENIEQFIQLQKLDVDKMEPAEVIKTKMLMSSMGLTSEEIDAHIVDTYHRVNEDHDEYDASKAARGGRQMKIDAAEGRIALKSMQSDIKTPDAEAQRLLNVEAANLETQKWEPVISSAVDKFTEIAIPLGDKDAVFKYEVSAESKAEMAQELRGMIESSESKLDAEGAELAQELLLGKYIVDNFKDIAKAIGVQARSMNDADWLKENHNPSALKPDTPPPAKQEEDAIEAILKFESAGQEGGF